MSFAKMAMAGAAGLFLVSVTSATAAVNVSPAGKPAIEAQFDLIKKKKKAGKKKDKPGKCGVMRYYSKKAKKCVNA